MALQTAPDFTLKDHNGTSITLSDRLKDKKVVLFFYPIASSPICTKQACHFRDLSSEFAQYNTEIYGISPDTVDKIHTFYHRHNLGFSLLADPDKTVAHNYHVARSGIKAAIAPIKRITFIINQDATILACIQGELRGEHHADAALFYLKEHDVQK